MLLRARHMLGAGVTGSLVAAEHNSRKSGHWDLRAGSPVHVEGEAGDGSDPGTAG